MNYSHLILSACVLTASAALAPFALATETPADTALPAFHKEASYLKLYDYRDEVLQAKLTKAMNARPGWKKLMNQKKMSVALVDIQDPENPRFASVNGQKTLYAASLPKIAILLAAFQKLEDGTMVDTPAVRSDMRDMIRVSSNGAATRMIDAVGGLDSVNEVLKDPRYGLYDTRLGGGLWVGKRYAKTGRRVGDPMGNISHAASTLQVARFYYLLTTGRLVSAQASADMLGIMSEPGINHKFVATLNDEVAKSDMYRKSGTWRTYHADSVLVWEPDGHKYILVGLVESADGGQMLKDLVGIAETALGFHHDN